MTPPKDVHVADVFLRFKHVMFLAPDINCALLKSKLTRIIFLTLLDQYVHVSSFGRSPVYVANLALAEMTV